MLVISKADQFTGEWASNFHVEFDSLVTVPSQLPTLGGVEAHFRRIFGVREAHHSALVAICFGAFPGMVEIQIVA